MADLSAIHDQITACTACALAKGRTNAVPGEGSPKARVMFVGEGPGYNEDRQGRPFVGAAGQFLNELLASIGLARDDVFITNMVKCRPPNNRDPFPGETAACNGYLDAQIEAIKPTVIIPLGRHALARWLPNESIGKVRAQPQRFGETTVLPLYHPAAALHNGNLRSTILSDFQKVRELLDAPMAEASGAQEPTPVVAASPAAEPALAAEPASAPQPSLLDAVPTPVAAAAPAPDPEPQGSGQLSLF